MHRNSRECTIGFFAPIFRQDLKFSPDRIAELKNIAKNSILFLENELSESNAPFLAGTEKPTLAVSIYAR